MTKESDCITVFAPATVANVGCGFDVLGFALEQPGDEVTLKKIEGTEIIIKKMIGAEDLPTHPDKNVAGVAIKADYQWRSNANEDSDRDNLFNAGIGVMF